MTKHHDGKRWNHRAGDWNRLYGESRRIKDRKLLEEVERTFALEEALGLYHPPTERGSNEASNSNH